MEEVLPHLYRIEVPLPNNPLKMINSWVILSDDRNLIIDTGMNRPECSEALFGGLEKLGVDMNKTDIFVSHLHADHLGLVATMMKESTKIYMGKLDAEVMEVGATWDRMGKMAGKSGFPWSELQEALKLHPGSKYGPGAVMKFEHLHDGDVIEVGDFKLQAIETPGHSHGHICLYEPDKKILFSGDHILRDITPNIQCWSLDDNPLQQYIDSLNKVYPLDMVRVLPGHRRIIEDGKGRINELKSHHLDRLNEVLDILKDGAQTGYQVAAQMSWDIRANSWEDFPIMQKWFATGEAISHLQFLYFRDLIKLDADSEMALYSANGGTKLETID